MRLTLERPELIKIIGHILGYDLDADDVIVSAEPFEVKITNVNLNGMLRAKEVSENPAPTQRSAQDSVLTMGDILNQNSSLGGPKPPANVVEEDVPLSRNLGPLESEEPPPITQTEILATLRGK